MRARSVHRPARMMSASLTMEPVALAASAAPGTSSWMGNRYVPNTQNTASSILATILYFGTVFSTAG